MTDPLPVYPVESATGVRIRLADGRELIDGMSSWWAAIHGYNHPVLNTVLREQAQKLSHVMFGGLTHEPAVELCQLLVGLTPEGLEKVFLCDSGSISVEVALKMALQYQHARGRAEKHRLLTIRGGYHGDTFHTMSVCDPVTGMHTVFAGSLPTQLFAPRPECRFDQSWHQDDIAEMANLLAEHGKELAAVILEPVVQGTGGMWFYHPQYLRDLRKLCDQYDVLLIFDEIATGFGRLGSMIEYKNQDCHPDIVSFGKMLTGGYLTFAATLTAKKISNSFLGKFSEGKHLFHGHTYTGNPIAASLSLENIKLYEKTKLIQKIQKTSKVFENRANEFYELELVGDVRQKGMLMGVELVNDYLIKTKKSINKIVFDEGRKHNIFFRTLGNVVMLVPPLAISNNEINLLVDGALKTVKGISKSLK